MSISMFQNPCFKNSPKLGPRDNSSCNKFAVRTGTPDVESDYSDVLRQNVLVSK